MNAGVSVIFQTAENKEEAAARGLFISSWLISSHYITSLE